MSLKAIELDKNLLTLTLKNVEEDYNSWFLSIKKNKTVRKFRDGGSFTSNMSFIYTPKDIWNLTGGFNFNRFANPQGYARWTTSMNLGLMKRFFNRKLTVTINTIDPFVQQRNRPYGHLRLSYLW